MPNDLLLVELYAGLASLSLWFVGGRPLLGRRGSKTKYAERIAGALFGERRPTRFLLNDADAGVANVLRCLCDQTLRSSVGSALAEAVELRARCSPASLRAEYASLSHEDDPAREAARWLIVSAGSGFGDIGSGNAFASNTVPRSQMARSRDFAPLLPELAARVRAWPLDTSVCDVRHGPAETLDPIGDAVAYLDPPYAGTNGYASVALLPPRSIAERWARAGCRVGLSETLASQAPLGWRCVDLSGGAGSGRQMIRAGRRELLFVSP